MSTDKKATQNQDDGTGLNPVQKNVIYRCGWCGYPVDQNGSPLSEIKTNIDANRYLDEHKDCTEVHVNGFCCPCGDESPDNMVQVSREMALDAGMPEIEGTLIHW